MRKEVKVLKICALLLPGWAITLSHLNQVKDNILGD